MTITVNTKGYNLDTFVNSDEARYIGPNHTMAANDLLTLRTSKSVGNANQAARAKAFATFKRSVTINGVVEEAFGKFEISIPVGMAEADVDSLRDDLGDFVISANGDDLTWKHDKNQ